MVIQHSSRGVSNKRQLVIKMDDNRNRAVSRKAKRTQSKIVVEFLIEQGR